MKNIPNKASRDYYWIHFNIGRVGTGKRVVGEALSGHVRQMGIPFSRHSKLIQFYDVFKVYSILWRICLFGFLVCLVYLYMSIQYDC